MSLRAQIVSQTRRPRFDRIGDYTVLPNLGKDSLARDGAIVVSRELDRGSDIYVVELSGPAFGLLQTDEPLLAGLAIDITRLHEHVELCRRKWRTAINSSPYRRRFWHALGSQESPLVRQVRQDERVLQHTGAMLARAGNDLFNGVFWQEGHPRLPQLHDRLRSALSGPSSVITIYADEFFLPWGLLYIHPPEAGVLDQDGSNWRPEGFVGHRHVIEQATDTFVPPSAIAPNEAGLAFGFTFDPSIDSAQGVSCVRSQRKFFALQQTLRRIERSTKREIEAAFRAPEFPDQISYFFLHSKTAGIDGRVLPARFFVGTESIEAAELQAWRNQPLGSEPLFFFNACQAGQMRTPFYQSFALHLLELCARGLIGPQIDIPTLFAEEYARRFFAALLERGASPPRRVGEIVRDLTRDFMRVEKNPLGLVYSLYKGLDCYLDWQSPVGDRIRDI